MKFKVSDNVVVINSNLTGKIVKIYSEDIIWIEDEMGFERKYKMSELIYKEDKISKKIGKIKIKDADINQNKKIVDSTKHPNFAKKLCAKEVDLHIEKLIDNIEKIKKEEILLLQMRKFVEELEKAIICNKENIIFIHGIGKGVLKTRIINELKTYYNYLKYEEAPYEFYQGGAILIRII